MENSDLIMRALQSHALALESEIVALRSDCEHATVQANEQRAEMQRVHAHLFQEFDPSTCNSVSIIAELQKRGVTNGGAKP